MNIGLRCNFSTEAEQFLGSILKVSEPLIIEIYNPEALYFASNKTASVRKGNSEGEEISALVKLLSLHNNIHVSRSSVHPNGSVANIMMFSPEAPPGVSFIFLRQLYQWSGDIKIHMISKYKTL